ncbi:MAG TPA: rhomboid family intramembrane serine protease [Chitinispirillaceae bacterium]|nr:rhomboid family intramembrane serine protease [Chitinispirillaceae bacterium]
MLSYSGNSLTKGVKWLLIITTGIFFFQLLPVLGTLLRYYFPLIPYETFLKGQLWRLATYMFMHDTVSPLHILFNMLVLWMFGIELENLWGTRRFTAFYIVCGIGSGLFSIISIFTSALNVPVIGASGAVLGVITAYASYFPKRQILLFFVLPINIRIFVLGYALYSVYGALVPHGNISHLTHLGGIIVALFYVKLYPYIFKVAREFKEKKIDRQRQQDIRKANDNKRFFEELIDPILDKINREGMESLTLKERELLKKAAQKDRGRLKNNKIVPFDPFR